MPTRAAEAAAAPPAQAERRQKKYTIRAHDEAARALAERRKMAQDAATWAYENDVGAKSACKQEQFEGLVTYNMVQPLLKKLKESKSIAVVRDHHSQVLTNDERRELAKWILACADGQDPKDREQVSVKIKELLKARHACNKRKKGGRGFVRLNREEVAVVHSKEPRLSKTFFECFYPWCRAHGIKIDEGGARSQDEKRAAKMTEATVTRHFHGEFGLEAELIDAGVMDQETKVIADPRRVLNCDETPQPIDAPQKGRRPKVAKRQGKAVRQATTTSKENVSVNMAWDLSGHLYGVQLVLKLKELHDHLVADAPVGAASFDDTVDLARKQSRTCTFSRTADGMQTQESFIQYLEQLNREITAHSEAAVAAGREPIERPVVLCLDNHASRYSEEVLTAASGSASRLGIRLFTEEPMTSGFLQSLDQYNSTFHRQYNKARSAYKNAYKARPTLCLCVACTSPKSPIVVTSPCFVTHAPPCSLQAHHKQPCTSYGLVEFVRVLGGDAELGLPGMWFSWADPFDIVNAWRKVGIAGNVLAPELIDRSEFIDQPAPGAEHAEQTPVADAPAQCNFAECVVAANDGSRTENLRADPCFCCKKAYFHHACCAAAGCEEDSRALCAACLEVPVFLPSPRVNRAEKRKRAEDLAKTPDGMTSGSVEAERAKAKALRAALEEREAEDDTPFNPTAAGLLVPDVVTRRNKEKSAGGRKRLSDLHGSMTMRDVRGEAAKRRAEAEAAEAAKQEKKRQALEKKEAGQKEKEEREAAFARCEVLCTCGVIPCPWDGWKRCPVCGPKKGLCKVRACSAARKPLLLGYNP